MSENEEPCHHLHPVMKWERDQMIFEYQYNNVPGNSGNIIQNNTVDFPYYTWPYFYWPCCYGTGKEQTMELEINGQKITILGKELKVKIEEVK